MKNKFNKRKILITSDVRGCWDLRNERGCEIVYLLLNDNIKKYKKLNNLNKFFIKLKDFIY